MLPKRRCVVKGIFISMAQLRKVLIFERRCCVILHMESLAKKLYWRNAGRLSGGNSAQAGSILYVGYDLRYALLRRRRLSGIRRCARAFGLDVATLAPEEATPGAVRVAIGGGRVAGCVVECWLARHPLPPRLFGSVPVVYFDPPGRGAWRSARKVECDEAGIARAAFRELSSGLPPCFAIVGSGSVPESPWARRRVAAFRACCRAAGKPCRLFAERPREDEESRADRLANWAASLPEHCAVFGVNDSVAASFARALSAAGRSLPRSATLVGVDAVETPEDGLPASDISSVKVDFELSGYLAAKALLEMGGMSATHGTPATRPGIRPGCPMGPSSPIAANFGPLFVERRASTRGFGRREPFVMEALEAIRGEACDGLSAAGLASRFPVSRKLFELRFREAMGHSVLDEILHVRMARVIDLLSQPDFPIGAIADFCGFDSGRELRDIFRSRTGTSLREWRKLRR